MILTNGRHNGYLNVVQYLYLFLIPHNGVVMMYVYYLVMGRTTWDSYEELICKLGEYDWQAATKAINAAKSIIKQALSETLHSLVVLGRYHPMLINR